MHTAKPHTNTRASTYIETHILLWVPKWLTKNQPERMVYSFNGFITLRSKGIILIKLATIILYALVIGSLCCCFFLSLCSLCASDNDLHKGNQAQSKTIDKKETSRTHSQQEIERGEGGKIDRKIYKLCIANAGCAINVLFIEQTALNHCHMNLTDYLNH